MSFQKDGKFKRNQKSVDGWNAAEILQSSQFYNESIVLFWSSTRQSIFGYIEFLGISYQSTNEALISFSKSFLEKEELLKDVLFLESVATLAEWDENFNIQEDELFDFKEICLKIIHMSQWP